MGDELFLRASDQDRNKVTNFLSDALAKGFITTDEMRGRLDVAIASKTFSDLLTLVKDIPGGAELVRDAARSHIRSNFATPQSYSTSSHLDLRPPHNHRHQTNRHPGLRVAALILGFMFFFQMATAGAFILFKLVSFMFILGIMMAPLFIISRIVRRSPRGSFRLIRKRHF
ncbi:MULTISPECIES: DUF1707 domain-containing protein [Acidithrix]|uniref:DUF1707 domain-containing protein n=1 Tax=Acidithrix ferrooxidans TaxID=1280514 RepID=A0A0D8HI93_9ACTN|nr:MULTISPECIES: DUF1707 domain-containing protein [Acidithrix]KJF17705.1 hypothetical protein AXFE_14130 [Acidithrix ferrooxidans]CAG4924399.1 unnamed protein product [Acidithrix sp. C25]